MKKSKTFSSSVSISSLFLLVACPLIALALGACAHEKSAPPPKTAAATPANANASAATDAEANLTQIEADGRAQGISNISYKIDLVIGDKPDTFTGHATIRFNLATVPNNLFLDFKNGAQIQTMTLNGTDAGVKSPRLHRLPLASVNLKTGVNVVDMSYTQSYAHDGRGLHRFVDPEDQRVYMYTQFESYDAHQLYPCFDQPDLKAKFTLQVTAPKDWEVVSTTRESKKAIQGTAAVWSFPETPQISTYLVSLHAGQYVKWESKAGKIPLRLFARHSIAKYVVPADWFKFTQQGLKFYGEYFAYPYPFQKYDQLIVPEFNAGAMENVAAITFSERYITRGKPTLEEREHLAGTLLHEMAHMWFGDLVTMQWWNGTWLNESFATFMSALAVDQSTEFKQSWMSFAQNEKSWAYEEDQRVTTHPIDGEVVDTNFAASNFDGITYGKGASVLKQLSYYLGDTTFRDGVRYYFKQHAYSNTRLDDFMGALEHASGKTLATWSQAWLKTQGLDSVRAEYDCDKGRIQHFALKLKGPDGKSSPRAHRTLVALYSSKTGDLKTFKTANVEYSGDSTNVPSLVGQSCPEFVMPNEQDYDYAKVMLDKHSLETVTSSLKNVQPAFSRALIWPTLHQMVRDAELAPDDFLKIISLNLPAEKELKLVDQVTDVLPELFYYLPSTTAHDKQNHDHWVTLFETQIWTRLLQAPPNSDAAKQDYDEFVDIVQSKAGRDRLMDLLSGSSKVKNITLDSDRRWNGLIRLSALGDTRADTLIVKEKSADMSDRGVQSALAADAIRPLASVKKEWFTRLVDKNDLPYSRQRAAIRHAFPNWQVDLRASLANDFYARLPKLAETRESEFLHMFTQAFIPVNCTAQKLPALSKFIDQHSEFPPSVMKPLRIARQEDERCIRVRAMGKNEP